MHNIFSPHFSLRFSVTLGHVTLTKKKPCALDCQLFRTLQFFLNLKENQQFGHFLQKRKKKKIMRSFEAQPKSTVVWKQHLSKYDFLRLFLVDDIVIRRWLNQGLVVLSGWWVNQSCGVTVPVASISCQNKKNDKLNWLFMKKRLFHRRNYDEKSMEYQSCCAFLSRCPLKRPGRSEAKSPVDIVRTRSWEGIV